MVLDNRSAYLANRYKPKKAYVAPIRSGQDDRRSAYLRSSFADNVNATREQNAINARNNDLNMQCHVLLIGIKTEII